MLFAKVTPLSEQIANWSDDLKAKVASTLAKSNLTDCLILDEDPDADGIEMEFDPDDMTPTDLDCYFLQGELGWGYFTKWLNTTVYEHNGAYWIEWEPEE